MTTNDELVRAYLNRENMSGYWERWFFHELEAGRNVFECPLWNPEQARNVEVLLQSIEKSCQDFRPANERIWNELFPDWREIPVHIDLIVGFPQPYDAVTMRDAEGNTHILLDLIRWCDYGLPKQPERVIRNLLAHEMTHVFIGYVYPEADEAQENTDYRTMMDARTFQEGFAHLIAYDDTGIGRVDWDSDFFKQIKQKSREKMREAIAETDPVRQKEHLRRAFCGRYEDKYACICGMLYLAGRWQKSGMNGLKESFSDFHGFAEKMI